MDRDFLKKKYEELKGKLGAFSTMADVVEAAVKKIVVPLKAGDVADTRARAVEAKEAAAALDAWASQIIADIDDDNGLDVEEIARGVAGGIGVIDEFEDVIKGKDEDDPV